MKEICVRILIIVYLCLLVPSYANQSIPQKDKLDHIIVSTFVMNFLCSIQIPNQTSAILVFSCGLIKELTDDTGFDIYDLSANIFGVGLGWIL